MLFIFLYSSCTLYCSFLFFFLLSERLFVDMLCLRTNGKIQWSVENISEVNVAMTVPVQDSSWDIYCPPRGPSEARQSGDLPGRAKSDWNSRQLQIPVESLAQDIHRFSQMVEVTMTLPSWVDSFQYWSWSDTMVNTQPTKPRNRATTSMIPSIF